MPTNVKREEIRNKLALPLLVLSQIRKGFVFSEKRLEETFECIIEALDMLE